MARYEVLEGRGEYGADSGFSPQASSWSRVLEREDRLGSGATAARLLLNEIILPARGVPLQMALWDIQMMTLLGGRERTESEWVELVEDTCSVDENLRLEVVRFWSPPNGAGEGIIEIIRRT